MGLRAGLDWCGKSRRTPGFEPRTVQPVASRYIDGAIPAPRNRVATNNYVHDSVVQGDQREPDIFKINSTQLFF